MLYYIYIYILIYIFNIFPRNFCMTTAWHIPGCSKAAMSGAAVARSCYKRKRTVSASWKLSTTRPPDAISWCIIWSCIFMLFFLNVFSHVFLEQLASSDVMRTFCRKAMTHTSAIFLDVLHRLPGSCNILMYYMILYFHDFFFKCIFACFSRATCIFRRYAHLLPRPFSRVLPVGLPWADVVPALHKANPWRAHDIPVIPAAQWFDISTAHPSSHKEGLEVLL